MKKITLIAFSAAMALATTAWSADPPKSHNNSGMRDACAADIATHCAGVAQGQATMQCVMKNRDKMSDGCKTAMSAMRQGGGMGAAPADAMKDKAAEKKPM